MDSLEGIHIYCPNLSKKIVFIEEQGWNIKVIPYSPYLLNPFDGNTVGLINAKAREHLEKDVECRLIEVGEYISRVERVNRILEIVGRRNIFIGMLSGIPYCIC